MEIPVKTTRIKVMLNLASYATLEEGLEDFLEELEEEWNIVASIEYIEEIGDSHLVYVTWSEFDMVSTINQVAMSFR